MAFLNDPLSLVANLSMGVLYSELLLRVGGVRMVPLWLVAFGW